jgi:aryl-alcohol dehydrogenase-like predicted oxidoreductase
MAAISHRALGAQKLSVSIIGLGCMSLSGVYGPADDAESEKLIRHAIDRGIDHLDSSDMYGWGPQRGGSRPRHQASAQSSGARH